MDAKACDDEVAEIMKIAERLQDCICQKYGKYQDNISMKNISLKGIKPHFYIVKVGYTGIYKFSYF